MKRWWVFIWWVFSILGAGSLELGGYFKTRSGFGGALQTCTLSRHDSGTLVVIYRKNDSVADLARPENVFSFVFPLFFPLSIFFPPPLGRTGEKQKGDPRYDDRAPWATEERLRGWEPGKSCKIPSAEVELLPWRRHAAYAQDNLQDDTTTLLQRPRQ